jgi:hypothetical protein
MAASFSASTQRATFSNRLRATTLRIRRPAKSLKQSEHHQNQLGEEHRPNRDANLRGTPTTVGLYTFTLQVMDANGNTGTQDFSLAGC